MSTPSTPVPTSASPAPVATSSSTKPVVAATTSTAPTPAAPAGATSIPGTPTPQYYYPYGYAQGAYPTTAGYATAPGTPGAYSYAYPGYPQGYPQQYWPYPTYYNPALYTSHQYAAVQQQHALAQAQRGATAGAAVPSPVSSTATGSTAAATTPAATGVSAYGSYAATSTAGATAAAKPATFANTYTPSTYRESSIGTAGGSSGMASSTTRSTRKPPSTKGLFSKELKSLMYGFGDDRNPASDTVNVMEEILVEYITDLCTTAAGTGSTKKARLSVEDLRRALSQPADGKKLARLEELLFMQEEIKRARTILKDSDGMGGAHAVDM